MFVSPSVYCVDVQRIVSELKCLDAVRSTLGSQQFAVSRAVVLIYSMFGNLTSKPSINEVGWHKYPLSV